MTSTVRIIPGPPKKRCRMPSTEVASAVCGKWPASRIAADMLVEVLIGCPAPESVDKERVLKVLPFGQKKIEVRQGGLSGKTIFQPEYGDKTDEMVVANAIVTVFVP